MSSTQCSTIWLCRRTVSSFVASIQEIFSQWHFSNVHVLTAAGGVLIYVALLWRWTGWYTGFYISNTRVAGVEIKSGVGLRSGADILLLDLLSALQLWFEGHRVSYHILSFAQWSSSALLHVVTCTGIMTFFQIKIIMITPAGIRKDGIYCGIESSTRK